MFLILLATKNLSLTEVGVTVGRMTLIHLEISQETWHSSLLSEAALQTNCILKALVHRMIPHFISVIITSLSKQLSILKYSPGALQTRCMVGLVCLCTHMFYFGVKSQRYLTSVVLGTATFISSTRMFPDNHKTTRFSALTAVMQCHPLTQLLSHCLFLSA